MPLKRRIRVKGQGKQKSSKSKESSSEDTDQCPAEEIVNRLEKKYLLKSSTDTEQSDQKENGRAAAKAADPYDADLETSEVDTAASVDTASDMECLELQPARRVLSPSRQANLASTRLTTRKGNPTKSKRGAQHPVLLSGRLGRESCSQPVPNRRHQESRRPSVTPQKATAVPVRTPKGCHSLQSDSGLFVSPLTNMPRHRLPRMNASDTSTPTSACGDVRSDLNDSCFGFENLIAPDPLAPISPVDPASPGSHASRSRSSLSDVSLTRDMSTSTSYTSMPVGPVKRKVSSVLDVTSLVQDPQPVKKTKKKFKPDAAKLAKVKEWAAHMAEEFEDIEMHELTIEG